MSDPPPRFITPQGFARIRAEYDELFGVERPKIVEVDRLGGGATAIDRKMPTISTASKRLREIDRRLSYLAKVMKAAKVVDPANAGAARPGALRRDRRACRRGR